MTIYSNKRGRQELEIARLASTKLGLLGNVYFVDYTSGVDTTSNGNSIQKPFKTVDYAEEFMKDRNNDVLFVIGSATNTGGTSQYVTSELVWDKNLCHMIGLGAARTMNQRVRITHVSTFTAADGSLITVSGDGCHFENINFRDGVTHAVRHAVKVTGNRNSFDGCSILGLEGALAAADGDSTCLYIYGGQENMFKDCYIGSNSVLRSAANANIRLRNYASRNHFKNCVARCYTSSATSLIIDANAALSLMMDTTFEGFKGINIPTGLEASAINLTVGVSVNSGSSGIILFDQTSQFVGCTKVAVVSPARVFVSGSVPTAATSNLSVVAA